MKKLMAFVLTAALSLTSAVVVFADEYDYDNDYAYGYENGYEYENVEVEAVVEAVNVPFTGVARNFIGTGGSMVGQFPTFANNTALTQRIETMINGAYQNLVHTHQIANVSLFSFEVEETLTAARVQIFMLNQNLVPEVLYTFYINKATNAVITAADFAESADAVEVAETADEEGEEEGYGLGDEIVVPSVEVAMRPLRLNAEAAGFAVIWDDGSVRISDESLALSILTGSVLATLTEAGEEAVSVTLDSAPINVAGTLYVPASLLIDILGIEFELLTTGATAPVAPPAETAPIVEEPAVELTAVQQLLADIGDDLQADLAETFIADVEVIVGEGNEIIFVFVFEDDASVEALEEGDAVLNFEEVVVEFRDSLGLDDFRLTVRALSADGTVLLEQSFES